MHARRSATEQARNGWRTASPWGCLPMRHTVYMQARAVSPGFSHMRPTIVWTLA